MGSGTRNLYKLVPLYSGKNVKPKIIDGDVFKVYIPLSEKIINDPVNDPVKKRQRKIIEIFIYDEIINLAIFLLLMWFFLYHIYLVIQ